MQLNEIKCWHDKQVDGGMDTLDTDLLTEMTGFPRELLDLIIRGNASNKSARVLATVSDAYTAWHGLLKTMSPQYTEKSTHDLLNGFLEGDKAAALIQINLVVDQAGGSLYQLWARQQCLAHARGVRVHVVECERAVFTNRVLANTHQAMRAGAWEVRLLALNSPELRKKLPYSIKKPNYPKIRTAFNKD